MDCQICNCQNDVQEFLYKNLTYNICVDCIMSKKICDTCGLFYNADLQQCPCCKQKIIDLENKLIELINYLKSIQVLPQNF